jgi:hypothetical protein
MNIIYAGEASENWFSQPYCLELPNSNRLSRPTPYEESNRMQGP